MNLRRKGRRKMPKIQFLEDGTNKQMGVVDLQVVPRIGEYIIYNDIVTANWKKDFYIVRAISYTLGGEIMAHIQHYDIDAMVEKNNEMERHIKELMQSVSKETK